MPEADPAQRTMPQPFTGASVALLSRLAARALGVAFVVLLAHRQSTRTFASYSYLLVLASTVSVITDAGVGLVANREVAGGRLQPAVAYRAALPTQLSTSALAGVGVLLVGALLPGPVVGHWAILWTAVFIFVNGLFDGQTELLRGTGRPWTEASLQLIAALMQVGLGVLVIVGGYGLAALMAVLAIKQALVVALAQRWLPAPWGPREPGLWRAFLRRGLWLGTASTLAVVAGRSAPLVLGNVGDTTQIAHFAVASRYLELATMICATAAFGLLPAMAQRAARDSLGQRRFMRRLLALTLVGSLALVALLEPIVPWLTVAVFGARYRGAVPASQVFVALLPVLALSSLAWYALIAERLEHKVTVAAGAGATIAAVAAVWIVAQPSALIAALATALSLGVTAAVALGALSRRGRASTRSVAAVYAESR